MPGHVKYLVSAVIAGVVMSTVCVVAPPSAPVGATAPTCARGGACRLGDVGPGGGTVFYAAGTVQWWGQYLEARVGGSIGEWGEQVIHRSTDAKPRRILGKQIGAGRENTDQLAAVDGRWAAVTAAVSTSDLRWQIPSKDELDALYNFVATSTSPLDVFLKIGWQGQPFWTSSEASDTFAWYQLFQDGTQFTDANGIVTGLTGNKRLSKSSTHKGSAFVPAKMRYVLVRSFAASGATLPPRPGLPTVPSGGRMSSSCAASVSCQVGDIGPGGGLIFYDAGTSQKWGRWLEVAPAQCQASGKAWRVAAPDKKGTSQLPLLYPKWSTAAASRIDAKRIGMGRINTSRIVRQHRGVPADSFGTTAAGYADSLLCGGREDWFLPSKDELDVLYNVLALTDNDLTGSNSFGFARGFYWTSSEYNNETAWTQLWIDGQQFDREKWFTGDARKDGGFNPFHVRPIRAFG